MNSPREILRECTASAAVEMALVTPLFMILLFGSVDLGKYFHDEHTIVEAVREGARYAARQPLDNYINSTTGCLSAPPTALQTTIKNLVRTGNTDGSGARLGYWTDNSTITISTTCAAASGGQTMGGIYSGITAGGAAVGAPVVTVSATLPYSSLFGLYTFSTTRNLNAAQQSVVTGV